MWYFVSKTTNTSESTFNLGKESTMNDEKYLAIINTYTNTLYRMAYSICKNKQDAEDVVQNTFLKLYTTDKPFESDEHLKNWLIKVTINNCKHIFMTPWKNKTVLLDEYKESGYYTIDHSINNSEVLNAVLSLPAKYRIVVHLYYYEDYSIREISKIIDEKETTIQTRLMRVRQKLKNTLKEVWQDEN